MKKMKAIAIFGILVCILVFGSCTSNGAGYPQMQEALRAENFEFGTRLDRMAGDRAYKTFALAELDGSVSAALRWVNFWFSIDDDSLVAITFSKRDVASGFVYLVYGIPYDQFEIDDNVRMLYEVFLYDFMYNEDELLAFAKWYIRENLPA